MKNKVFAVMLAGLVMFAGCSGGVVDNKDTQQSVNILFDDEAKDAILGLIDNSSQTIHIQLYQLGDENVIEALGNALRRGIVVKIILSDDSANTADKEFFNRATGGQVDMEEYLEKAGATVKWVRKAKLYIFHRKVAVFDGKTVFLGSSNWTRTGLTNNSELNALIVDRTIAGLILSRFNDDFNIANQSYLTSRSR